MHNKLVLEAFKRAKKKSGSNKRHRNAKEISDYISEVTKEGLGEARLAQYHRIAVGNSEPIILKSYVEKALCQYLEYKNFDDFKLTHPTETKNLILVLIKMWRKCWFKFLLYHLLLILIGIVIYTYVQRERWMVWNGKEYIEIPFDTDKYGTRMKVYKKERIEHFEKVDATCDTLFFNPNGSPRIWYGKNKDGILEYFTDLARHPETGKSLKPISQHMIDKYICVEE